LVSLAYKTLSERARDERPSYYFDVIFKY